MRGRITVVLDLKIGVQVKEIAFLLLMFWFLTIQDFINLQGRYINHFVTVVLNLIINNINCIVMASTQSNQVAKLLASKMLRTTAFHRPAPSLFFFPGLNTQPYHKAEDFSFTRDFESNISTI